MASNADPFDCFASSGLTSGTPMVRHRTLVSKRRTLLVVALLGVIASAPLFAMPVHRNGKKRVSRQTIEGLEEQWRQAQLSGDVTAMDRLLADDFVGITAFGQVTTKAQQLARVRDRVIVLTRLDLSDMKVKLLGSIAVVTTRAEVDGSSDGRSIAGAFRYTRVYHRLPNGSWKITSFEATRVPSGDGRRSQPDAEAAPTPHP
jgi:ketosteroid isomerase-like protein